MNISCMHKYSIYIAALLIGVIAPTDAIAENSKTGYVNTARLLKEAPQAEAARKKLENEFAPRDKKIVRMQKKLKRQEDKLGRDISVLSDSARKKMERQIVAAKRDIKRSREEFSEDLNIRRNEELGKLQKLVYDTITGLARDKNFDIILGDSVIFASKRIDLTDQVLERLKQNHKTTTNNK